MTAPKNLALELIRLGFQPMPGAPGAWVSTRGPPYFWLGQLAEPRTKIDYLQPGLNTIRSTQERQDHAEST